MIPDSSVPEKKRAKSEDNIPGGFPASDEPVEINGHTSLQELSTYYDPLEQSPSPAREASEVPTLPVESPQASPVPPSPSISRGDDFTLENLSTASALPSRVSTPASLRRGAWKKPVLKHYSRSHPLKKQYAIEQKMKLMNEIHKLKKASGYSQDLKTFRGYMSYREHLETWLSAYDKKLPPPPITYGLESLPPLPSSHYLQRTLENARKTFESPFPTIPPFSVADEISRRNRERDAEIESRLRPKLPESLPLVEEERVAALLKDRTFKANCMREEVTIQDLPRLGPKQWLNDEIINFFGAMILDRSEKFHANKGKDEGKGNSGVNGLDKGKERAKLEDFPEMEGVGEPLKVHVFNTFFMSKLQDLGYEKAKLNKWTKKVDIFSKDLVLIPCNLGNSHWTTAAINFKDKRIEYYDSMGMKRPSIHHALRLYLDKEHLDKKKAPFDFTGWEDFFTADTPQQENGFDCGVFVCQTMENLSRGVGLPFDFTQKNMPYLRKRMVVEIKNERLEVKRLPFPPKS